MMLQSNETAKCLCFVLLLLHSSLVHQCVHGAVHQLNADYEAPEPYSALNGYIVQNDSRRIPESPDPLVSYRWKSNVDDSKLQYYRIQNPTSYQISPTDAIQGIESFWPEASGKESSQSASFTVYQNCTLQMDWGVERAAWMELISFTTSHLSANTSFRVRASLSEFDVPYPGKTQPLKKYGNHTYRLETNPELYEGVRYTWLFFEFLEENPNEGIAIQDISLVAKVKPVNYTGSFHSSDANLTRAWYTGAYGVRLNMEESNFNSVLVERGDRVAIQGDGHPTIAAGLVAFSPYSLVKNVLLQTDSGNHSVVDENIMAYPLYWSLSVMDYYMESGDLDTFAQIAKDIMKILDARIQDFLSPDLDIQWFGWDDRLGNGWCFRSKGDHCPEEAHLAFAALVVRVCRDFSQALMLAYMPRDAQRYHDTYKDLGKRLKSIPQWPERFGVHAAANAINSGIATHNETNYWMSNALNDQVNLCSVSQFNQYWILQSYGNAGRMEQALGSIKLCWSPPLELGKGCFWENSSHEWLSFLKPGNVAPGLPSYCHPWASGVTAWLSHFVGGIRPILPGYEQVLVAPYLSKQYPSVGTNILTPQGEVRIDAHLMETGHSNHVDITVHVSIHSPVAGMYGFRSELYAPNGNSNSKVLSIHKNGAMVRAISSEQARLLLQLPSNSATLLPNEYQFVALDAGVYTNFTIHYRETTEESQDCGEQPFPEPHYPATVIGIDRQSRGNGLTRHGADGYALLGHNNGEDVVRLPSYVQNVTFHQHGYPGWRQPQREFIGRSLEDPRYLLDYRARNGTKLRKLGMVGFDDSRGGQINNLFLHIEMKDTRGEKLQPCALSVYFVAMVPECKHAIRAMDLETLNIIAPTTLIEDYAGGVWWTLEYNKSVRLRLTNMKGIRVSAVAFANPHEAQSIANTIEENWMDKAKSLVVKGLQTDLFTNQGE